MNAARWVVMFPAAVIGGLAVYYAGLLITMFLQWFYFDTIESANAVFWIHAASSACLGGGFVWTGTYVAPTHKKNVAYSLLAVAVVLACVLLGLGLTYGLHWREAIDALAMPLGAWMAVSMLLAQMDELKVS